MQAEFQDDTLEDIYTGFEEGLEDDECTAAEAGFIRGYMEYEESEEEL